MSDATATPPPHTTKLMGDLVLLKDEVAQLLKVKPATVENLHRSGQLRGFTVGDTLHWKPADVRAFVDGLGESV